MSLKTNNLPELLQIELTYKCNLSCIFCYNPLRNKEINQEKIERIVDRVCEFKIPQVYLIGGEPSVLGVETLNRYIDKLSKTSSVTIVTNGFIKLVGISKKLAVMAVSLHGYDAKSHERFNGVKGSYDKAIESISYYNKLGLNVRCVVVLNGYNYNKMDRILLKCIEAGASEIFIDRYEDGGIGATNSNQYNLKPTNEQFREALTQIIKIRNMELIPKEHFGFGTAIPYCLDRRMFEEQMLSTCGAGTQFCAISPSGDLRICNQSTVIYGNVLEKDIDEIWSYKNTSNFRNLEWVEEPCKSCKLLNSCQGGCRVDANCKKPFTIDYAIREGIDEVVKKNIEDINQGKLNFIPDYKLDRDQIIIDKNERYEKSQYLRLNKYKNMYYLVTQFNGTRVGENDAKILNYIISQDSFLPIDIIKIYNEYDEESIIELLKILFYINGIQKKEVSLIM